MNKLKSKAKKKYIILFIFIILTVALIAKLTYKPFGEYNQHPMPSLIGTLKGPEYREGGCVNYEAALNTQVYPWMISPNHIYGGIALEKISDEIVFLKESKKILNQTYGLHWIMDSYSFKDDSTPNYFFTVSISSLEWGSISYENKRILINDVLALFKGQKEKVSGEFFIYRCDGLSAKWTGYGSIDEDGEEIIRFDWARSILEEFLDDINPFSDIYFE